MYLIKRKIFQDKFYILYFIFYILFENYNLSLIVWCYHNLIIGVFNGFDPLSFSTWPQKCTLLKKKNFEISFFIYLKITIYPLQFGAITI